MKCYSLSLKDADDIESFYLETTGMVPDYLRLSTGVDPLRLHIVELTGVTLIWARSNAHARWRDSMTCEGLHLGYLIECDGSVAVRGRDIAANDVQLWMPGQEMDYVLRGPYLSLEIGVEEGLVQELGWSFEGKPEEQVPSSCLTQLTSICQRATRATGHGQSAPAPAPHLTAYWRDQILEALEGVLGPWLSAEAAFRDVSRFDPSHYRLVRQADDLLEAFDDGAPANVDQLAELMGTSRRTVFQAYRSLLGVGPWRYLEIRRLNTLRSLLKQSSHLETTVTELAMEVGFGDLGRMAGRYRMQFGENPSETLRRNN